MSSVGRKKEGKCVNLDALVLFPFVFKMTSLLGPNQTI